MGELSNDKNNSPGRDPSGSWPRSLSPHSSSWRVVVNLGAMALAAWTVPAIFKDHTIPWPYRLGSTLVIVLVAALPGDDFSRLATVVLDRLPFTGRGGKQ